MTTPNCPKCQSNMVLRTNSRDNSKFYGCSKFPACRGTRNYTTEIVAQPQETGQILHNILSGKPFNPSQRQIAILQEVLSGQGNLFVDAKAGTGKSTTCAWIISQLPRNLDVVYFAFNKAIATEFRSKYGFNASTMHSYGFQCLGQALGKGIIVQANKKNKIAQIYFPAHKSIRKFIVKLASLAINTQTDYTDVEALKALISEYGVETDASILEAKDDNGKPIQFETILKTVASVILDSLEMVESQKLIDYDEMLYYPVFANLIPQRFDMVFVDEYQDTNMLQVEFVKKTVKAGGRFVLVGDKFQAIYAFRGAQAQAIDRVEEFFSPITRLPLDMTYRCPQSHIREMANRIVKDIVAAPQNPEGVIRVISDEAARQEWRQLDEALIMCRNNAPLVKACLALIKTGKRAFMAGRNIAEGLIDMVEQMDASSVDELINKLEDYRGKEIARLMERDLEEQADLLNDKVECVLGFCDGLAEVPAVIRKIDSLFVPDDERSGKVLFSSIHRAKGLESKHCFGIGNDLLTREDIHGQWLNLAYVEVTRSLLNFTWVDKQPNWSKLSRG